MTKASCLEVKKELKMVNFGRDHEIKKECRIWQSVISTGQKLISFTKHNHRNTLGKCSTPLYIQDIE